ncbi:MAG: hypothetical protein IGR92_09300 [Leptolyngbyaceae cyanobacterium T60_A2020_046]|nr:hypothetical protein [Leptolyngbyaceae cyanobacterium T60_A2020_046]
MMRSHPFGLMLGLMLSLGIIAPQPAQSVPCPCACGCPSAEFGPQPRDHADVPFPLPATVECLVYSVFEASEV